MVAGEHDGSGSDGLLRLPGYVATLKSGWADGCAVRIAGDAAPSLVTTEASKRFAQRAYVDS